MHFSSSCCVHWAASRACWTCLRSPCAGHWVTEESHSQCLAPPPASCQSSPAGRGWQEAGGRSQHGSWRSDGLCGGCCVHAHVCESACVQCHVLKLCVSPDPSEGCVCSYRRSLTFWSSSLAPPDSLCRFPWRKRRTKGDAVSVSRSSSPVPVQAGHI